jgi:hypothetical protein
LSFIEAGTKSVASCTVVEIPTLNPEAGMTAGKKFLGLIYL